MGLSSKESQRISDSLKKDTNEQYKSTTKVGEKAELIIMYDPDPSDEEVLPPA